MFAYGSTRGNDFFLTISWAGETQAEAREVGYVFEAVAMS